MMDTPANRSLSLGDYVRRSDNPLTPPPSKVLSTRVAVNVGGDVTDDEVEEYLRREIGREFMRRFAENERKLGIEP